MGMLASAAAELPSVRSMCDKASEILGYDLLDVCVNGPKEKSRRHGVSAARAFVAGLAAVEKLRAESPETVASWPRAAGLSLGEYTALVFAGAMSFEDGLRVVRCRAEAMKAAAAQGDHGMLSVVGPRRRRPRDVRRRRAPRHRSQESRERFDIPGRSRRARGARWATCGCSPPGASLRNAVRSDAPSAQARDRGSRRPRSWPVERVRREHVAHARAGARAKITEPKIATYSNVTGTFFKDAASIPDALAAQLVSPVRWEDSCARSWRRARTRCTSSGR